MEEKVIDISCNMAFLMVALVNKFGPFRDVGNSNSEVGLGEKLRDNKDPKKDSRKYPEKEQSSSSGITPSQYLFKMETKVDIKPYQGDIDLVKLNHWFQQLEVCFSVHNKNEEKNISFS
jgi:hypothetical protein